MWQGKVYHRGGKVELDGEVYLDFEEETGYGTGPGLGGWNCRHSFGVFIPGISERMYTDADLDALKGRPVEYNGKTYTEYEASQYQRRMEAKMREYKRNLAGLEAAGSPVTMDLQNMSIRYQRLRQEYIKFSKSMGLPTQFERTGV